MSAVYVHIPFCRTICPYCDFVRVRDRGAPVDAFVDGLRREIAWASPADAPLRSVFFGGGTPSLLDEAQLGGILDALDRRFGLSTVVEVTLEANPDDVTAEKARMWRRLGINRASLGVQSFDDAVLRRLGRRHGADGARRACETIGDAFANWSMDLIYGARPVGAWTATLEECVRFGPPHVSAYGLTYEAGTPFERRRGEAIEDDDSLALYRELRTALGAWKHYEISNFARPGRESAHNLVYWRNEPYYGFGTGAYSFLHGVRARNTTDLHAYLAHPGAKCESLGLTLREVRLETVIQHMRLADGLTHAAYQRRFGRALREDYGPALDALVARGLLTDDGVCVRPTAAGFELNNEIGLALLG